MERRRQGEHSSYGGWPWLAMRIPFVRDEVKAKGLESAIVFVSGVFMLPMSEPIGQFVMLTAFGLAIVHVMDVQAGKTRARQMRDAMIEMQQMVQDVRRSR